MVGISLKLSALILQEFLSDYVSVCLNGFNLTSTPLGCVLSALCGRERCCRQWANMTKKG